jgi:hypothetical protein
MEEILSNIVQPLLDVHVKVVARVERQRGPSRLPNDSTAEGESDRVGGSGRDGGGDTDRDAPPVLDPIRLS